MNDASLKNVWRVDFFLIMGDVQVVFGILIHWFMQQPLYLLWCTLDFSTFIDFLASFDSSVLQVFGCLLGLGSFDSASPWRLLTRKHVFLLIAFNGIRFIQTPPLHWHPFIFIFNLGFFHYHPLQLLVQFDHYLTYYHHAQIASEII